VSLRIQPVPIGVYGANAFVVQAPSGRWIAIDAASPAAMRQAAGGGEPDYLILTHEHFDHIAGLGVAGAFQGVPLMAAEECAKLLSNPAQNLSKYDPEGRILSVRLPDICIPAAGREIDWQGHRIELTPAPGHSPGGLLVHADSNLFAGDTLLNGIRTVTKLPGGNRPVLKKSLAWIFGHFPGETLVWPGHGKSFRLSETSIGLALDDLSVDSPDARTREKQP
jgi:hydroxyacylglutathione hydrolase